MSGIDHLIFPVASSYVAFIENSIGVVNKLYPSGCLISFSMYVPLPIPGILISPFSLVGPNSIFLVSSSSVPFSHNPNVAPGNNPSLFPVSSFLSV